MPRTPRILTKVKSKIQRGFEKHDTRLLNRVESYFIPTDPESTHLAINVIKRSWRTWKGKERKRRMIDKVATRYHSWWETTRDKTEFTHRKYPLDLQAIRFHQKAGTVKHEETVWQKLLEALQEPFSPAMLPSELDMAKLLRRDAAKCALKNLAESGLEPRKKNAYEHALRAIQQQNNS